MHAKTTCLADVEPRSVTWLWQDRIARGKITELVGDPGVGKSTLIARIAADITRGRRLPGNIEDSAPAPVLLLSAEDGLDDTIRPRLDAAGAEVTLVHSLDAMFDDNDNELPCFRDADHLAALFGVIETLRPALLAIDPITAYLGDTDSHRDSDVRSVLAPLADIAERTGVAVVNLRHLRKGAADRAIYRAGGSIAFTAAARSQLLAGCDPDDDASRAVIQTKNNLAPLAPAVGYRIVDGRLDWCDTELTAGRMLRPESTDEDRSDKDEAVAYLRAMLAAGPRAVDDIRAEAKRLGVKDSTLRSAKEAAGVKSERVGGVGAAGSWIWRLPANPSTPAAKVTKMPTQTSAHLSHVSDGVRPHSAVDVDLSARAKMRASDCAQVGHLSELDDTLPAAMEVWEP